MATSNIEKDRLDFQKRQSWPKGNTFYSRGIKWGNSLQIKNPLKGSIIFRREKKNLCWGKQLETGSFDSTTSHIMKSKGWFQLSLLSAGGGGAEWIWCKLIQNTIAPPQSRKHRQESGKRSSSEHIEKSTWQVCLEQGRAGIPGLPQQVPNPPKENKPRWSCYLWQNFFLSLSFSFLMEKRVQSLVTLNLMSLNFSHHHHP